MKARFGDEMRVIPVPGQFTLRDITSLMNDGAYEKALHSRLVAVNHALRIHQELARMGIRKLRNCVTRIGKVDQAIDRRHRKRSGCL
jgi:hypothetical protein